MSDSILLADERPAARTPWQRMEEDLVAALREAGLVKDAQLEEARVSAGDRRLSTRLWQLGIVTEEELRQAFASFLRIPCAQLEAIREGAHEHAGAIPRADVEKARLVAVATRPGKLMVATTEPWRLALFEDLGERLGVQILPCFLDEAPLARLLEETHEVPADPDLVVEPELRTRPLVRELPDADANEGESSAELMSETQFDDLYQR